MKLSGIRQKVFLDRYALKDKRGRPVEKTPEQMWRRVARGVATVEEKGKRRRWEKKFYQAMKDFKYVPGGRILSGAGTGYKVTFYNCFVLPSPHDSRDGILDNLKEMVEIMARGGGVGINLSSLRPRGARVKKVNGFSSGPMNWAELYSVATHDIIQQGGCFAPDTKIMTHRGLVSVEEMVNNKDNYYVATHQGYQKVTAKFNNGRKKIYEVKTKSGFSVKVTKEHKFVTFNQSGQFYLKSLEELKKGDSIVLLLGDWLDELPYVALNTSLPRPSKYSYGLKKIRLPKVLDEDLAFVLGVYAADGCKIADQYSRNGKGIRLAVDAQRVKDLHTLIATLKRVFKVEVKVRNGDGAVKIVQIFSRRINEFLVLNDLLKKSSQTVTVPSQIFVSPRSVVEAYIAGVFFGDGTNRGGKGGLRITTVSEKFARQLQLLLLNLGIAAKLMVRKRRHKNWRTIYTVTVNGATFMKRFIRLLAPYTDKVVDKKISVRDGAFGWPFNLVNRFNYVSGYQRTQARTNPTTSQKSVMLLKQVTPALKEADRQDIEFLAACVPDTIFSISLLGESQVYDLEVNKVHLLSGNGFYTSNSRRGALMLMLWDWHPDIEEFITVKKDLSRITGANLSVCVSDKFMEAVKKNKDWKLVFPDLNDPEYDQKWRGYLDDWLAMGKKIKVYKQIKARKLWDLICEAAWASAEPGTVFMERYNKWNNNWYFNKINCVNPCVTGDTLVATTEGIFSIRELYKKQKPLRIVVNGKYYLSSPVKRTGYKKVYRLKTYEGYELRLTRDHQVFTPKGKKEAGKLRKGEKILLSSGGAFGTSGSIEDGMVLGWLVGDGSVKKDVATLFFYHKEKTELAPQFALMINKMVGVEGMTARVYPVAPQYIEKENKAVIESVRLWRIVKRYGLSHQNKYIVPDQIFKGSEQMQRGFLQALFSSDGSVVGTLRKGVSVRLTSVSKTLLIDVQRLLLNFGIVSKIYQNRRSAGKRLLPDGKGGRKLYSCQSYHELVISKANLIRFAALIGFLQQEKQDKLVSLLSLYRRGPYKERFIATFKELVEEDTEEVFDLTVADIHRFSANGFIISNCGEEGLPEYGVCNLGSINLSQLVDGKGKFDYRSLKEIVHTAVRFQDNVIDEDIYIFPQIRETQLKGERRIGLGTMGLGDALIKMKIKYGSKKSLKVIDRIYRAIRDEAYKASVDIAKEKGAFPKFEAEKYLQGYFIKQLPQRIRQKIKKYGIRNSVLLMQAPTGSTSLLSGTSSGIEPVYEFSFIRHDRLGEHKLYHPLYEKWRKEHPGEPVPDYFVSSNDLTPEDHVRVQAAIQKYVDASISKTVNAPKTYTVADVKKLYTLAYDLGCKGITFMREGSRPGVLEREKKTEKAETRMTEKQPVVWAKKTPRPPVVRGSTYQVHTPVGIAYVTINTVDGEPLEVFINIGKAGSDVQAMAEALGRIISLNLRMASPLSGKERIKLAFNELIGIGGSRSLGFGPNRVRSLPDAIAKAIASHFGFRVRNGNGPVFVGNGEVKEIKGVASALGKLKTTVKSLVSPISAQNSLPYVESVDLCPECGEAALAYEEGCKKCYSCGFSEC